MPQFQLLIREPGREPRTIQLDDRPITIGRSRNVDEPVSDQEVGRKQFRIGVNQGFVVLDGIGSTNPTRVDSRPIAAGESTTLDVGQKITVGKSEFILQVTGTTAEETLAPPEPIDVTMVAGGPGTRPGTPPAGQPPASTPPTETSSVPLNTMEFRPPGVGGNAPPVDNGPPTDNIHVSDVGQTMAKGFRPGAIPPKAKPPTPAPAATPQPAAPAEPAPAEPAPAKPAKPAPAKPEPAKPATAKPAAAKPAAAKPATAKPATAKPATGAEPVPPQPRAVGEKSKPKTVTFSRGEIPALAADGVTGTDLESLLHRSSPRLFVKGEGLKRPVRLMKPANEVGRAESADVLLPHESVSEQHAQICFDGKAWTLLDHGSTNGTIVDGTHLRGDRQEIRRNSLIGIGALQMIFLCLQQETAASDHRDEDRALQLLTNSGRLDKTTANDIRKMARLDSNQSIAEIVLRDTALSASDWAEAVATARNNVSLLDRILRLFRLRQK